MNKTLSIYGTTNPVIVVGKITNSANYLSAPLKDFLKADARSRKYAYEEQAVLQDSPEFRALRAREETIQKIWMRNNDVRHWNRETPTQKRLERELSEVRTEIYQKYYTGQARARVLLAQFIAQSYLRRNRKDFR